MLQVHITYSLQLTEPGGSPSHPQTSCYNPLILSQQLNLPPVSYRILLSSFYNLNTTGAAWLHVRKIDRYILFHIPVTLALLNFAFQPISRLIHHACQVCLFNPLKDRVGLHYTTSCLPKCFALQFWSWFWCVRVSCVGVGVGGWRMLDVQRSFKLALLASCGESRFCEVIDMQITRGVCIYFQAALRLATRSITLWKCAADSLGFTVWVG